jgi:hypothetical protein
VTFAEHAAKSVSDARVLAQIDIVSLNSQWVNAGAGIWKMNTDGLYPEVDDSLLDGFTAQTAFTDIGSVTVDAILQTAVASLGALTDTMGAYYWDNANNDFYICLAAYQEPWVHTILLGVIHGYSFDEFTPAGSNSLYEGRLLGSPSVEQARDPLFWGKLQFNLGGFSLINADGAYDGFARDNNVYGNEARFYFGFKQLDIADYLRIHSGTIQDIDVGEEEIGITLADKRAQLSKPIQYQCTALNALDAIVEILGQSYNVQYNATYYDTTAWAAAQALVPVITIDMKEERPTIDVIEDICGSVFGLFKIEADNRFSAKIVDTTASSLTTIVAADIINHHTVGYKSGEVISSVKVGYAKDWDSDYVSPYTFLTDTSRENAVYLKYKTYNQKTFYTLLTTFADAQAFAMKILDYAQDVHGQGELVVPMKYYPCNVGDMVDAVIDREGATMLGTQKVELLSKRYNLREANLGFRYRIT